MPFSPEMHKLIGTVVNLFLNFQKYIISLYLRNGKRAACNHGVMDARGRLLSTKEAYRLVRL